MFLKKICKRIYLFCFYFLLYYYFFITNLLSAECYIPVNNEIILNTGCDVPADAVAGTYNVNKMYLQNASFFSVNSGIVYDFGGAIGSGNDVSNAVLGVVWKNALTNAIINLNFINLDHVVIDIISNTANDNSFSSFSALNMYSSVKSKGVLNLNMQSSLSSPMIFYIDSSVIAGPNGVDKYGDLNLNLDNTSFTTNTGTSYTLGIKNNSKIFLDDLNINMGSTNGSPDLVYLTITDTELNIESINIYAATTMTNSTMVINFFSGTEGVVNNIIVSDSSQQPINTQINFENVSNLSIGEINLWGTAGNGGDVFISNNTSLHVGIFDFTDTSDINDYVSVDSTSVLYVDDGILLATAGGNRLFDVDGILYLGDVLQNGYGYVGMNSGSKMYITGDVHDLDYIELGNGANLYVARDSSDFSVITTEIKYSDTNKVEYISNDPNEDYIISVNTTGNNDLFNYLTLNNGIYSFSAYANAKYKTIKLVSSTLTFNDSKNLEGTFELVVNNSIVKFVNITGELIIPTITASGTSDIIIENSGKSDEKGIFFNTHMNGVNKVDIMNSKVTFSTDSGSNFFKVSGQIKIQDKSVVNVSTIYNDSMMSGSSIFISDSDLTFLPLITNLSITIGAIYGDNTKSSNNVNFVDFADINFNSNVSDINLDLKNIRKTQFNDNISSNKIKLAGDEIGKQYIVEFFKNVDNSTIEVNSVGQGSNYRIYFRSGSTSNSNIIINSAINVENSVIIDIEKSSSNTVFDMDFDIMNNSSFKQELQLNNSVNIKGSINNMYVNMAFSIENNTIYLYDSAVLNDVDFMYKTADKQNLDIVLKNTNSTYNFNDVGFYGNYSYSVLNIVNDSANNNSTSVKNAKMGLDVVVKDLDAFNIYKVNLVFEGKIINVHTLKVESSVFTYNVSDNLSVYKLAIWGSSAKFINSKGAKIDVHELEIIDNFFNMDSNVSVDTLIDIYRSTVEFGNNKIVIKSGTEIFNQDNSTIKFVSDYAFASGVSLSSVDSKIMVENFKITGLDQLNTSNTVRLSGSSKEDQLGIIINTNYAGSNSGYIQTNAYDLGSNSIIHLVSSDGYDVDKKYLLIEDGNGSGSGNIDSGALIVIDDLRYYATYEVDANGNVYAKIACVDPADVNCKEPVPPEPPIPPENIPENSKVCDSEETIKDINSVILDGIQSGNYDDMFQHDMSYANADMDNINYSYSQMMPVSNSLRKNNIANISNQMKYVMNNRDFQTTQMYLNKYDGYYLEKDENNFEWFINIGGYLGVAKNCIDNKSNMSGENLVIGGEYKVLIGDMDYFVFGVSFGYGSYEFLDQGLVDITTGLEVNQYEINGSVYSGAIYGEYDFFNNYLRVFSQYTMAVNNMDRFVNINTIAAINNSNSKDYNLLVNLEYGYNNDYIDDNVGFYMDGYGGNGISFNPYIGVNYIKYKLSDYTETGNGFSLYVEGDEYTEILPYAGLRLKKNIFIGKSEKSYLMPILDFFVVFSNKSSIYYTTFNFNHIYGDSDITSLDDSLYGNNSLNVNFSLNYVYDTNVYWEFKLGASVSKNQNFVKGLVSFRYVL